MTVTQRPLPTRSSSSSSSPVFLNLRSRTAMADEGKIPQKHSPRTRGASQGSDFEGFLSPGFKSVAAMAGWDEEALLASLVVEDTPEREKKEKKRPTLQFKTPPTNSRRKRRAQRRSPVVIPATVLVLDEGEAPVNGVSSIRPTILDLEEENSVNDGDLKKKEEAEKENAVSKKKDKKGEVAAEGSSASAGSTSTLPNLDKLREELSCAICLEICYEPSTTPCGHSFCKRCLRSAADKCGKRCPKCRQLISNGRSCTVNTVLWNTIQLLFPSEVEARKAAASPPSGARIPTRSDRNAPDNNNNNVRVRRASRPLRPPTSSREGASTRSNISAPSQDEDAALALRLQREEFLEAYRPSSSSNGEHRSSATNARATLRAMASRAVSLRTRNRPTHY